MEPHFIDWGTLPAERIMEKDAATLASLSPQGPAKIHFYRWQQPTATYGCFLKPEKLLDLQALEACGITLAKRPTGGGLLFHLTDFAFSVLVPTGHPLFSQNTLENYALINEAVRTTLEPLHSTELLIEEHAPLTAQCRHFCLAKPTQFDVMVGGRKIAGAAQRRTKAGFLHQGSINIAKMSKELLKKVLLLETGVIKSMELESDYLLPESYTLTEWEQMRTLIADRLHHALMERLSWKG